VPGNIIDVDCEPLLVVRNDGVEQKFHNIEAGSGRGDIIRYV
jgi:hypothetical protein